MKAESKAEIMKTVQLELERLEEERYYWNSSQIVH